MAIQGAINKLIGTAGAAATLADKISKGAAKNAEPKAADVKGGKDLKAAQIARKTYQQKINAIYANKDLSAKARTRRVCKLLDEYGEGGK